MWRTAPISSRTTLALCEDLRIHRISPLTSLAKCYNTTDSLSLWLTAWKENQKRAEKILTNDRESTQTFNTFGLAIKYGIYQDFGAKRTLKDLLVYHSLNEGKYVTVAEYVEKMDDDQPHIYYISPRPKAISRLPQLERLRRRDTMSFA